MSEYGFPGIPDDVRNGGTQREKKSAAFLLEVVTKLRTLITRANGGGDRQGVRELHQMLLTIHPDVSPGNTPEEVAAFERLTKVAIEVLSWYRGVKSPSYRDKSKILETLSDIESKFVPHGSSQPSGARPFRVRPGESEWGSNEESGWGTTAEGDEEEEKPPYETENIKFDSAFVGKQMFEVRIDLEDDVAAFVIDPEHRGDEYGGRHALKYFEIEDVDGVVVAYSSSDDEYRSNFGGWKIIKGLAGHRIRGLGKIESFESFGDEESFDDGYNHGTRVRLSKGAIRFGTRAYDAYYPSGYCDVE